MSRHASSAVLKSTRSWFKVMQSLPVQKGLQVPVRFMQSPVFKDNKQMTDIKIFIVIAFIVHKHSEDVVQLSFL